MEMWWHPDPDVREQYGDSDDDNADADKRRASKCTFHIRIFVEGFGIR